MNLLFTLLLSSANAHYIDYVTTKQGEQQVIIENEKGEVWTYTLSREEAALSSEEQSKIILKAYNER